MTTDLQMFKTAIFRATDSACAIPYGKPYGDKSRNYTNCIIVFANHGCDTTALKQAMFQKLQEFNRGLCNSETSIEHIPFTKGTNLWNTTQLPKYTWNNTTKTLHEAI